MNESTRKINRIGCLVCCLAMLSMPAFAATDYSTMTTEELAARRGTMQNATEEERNAFRNEWRERIRNMNPEERQQYMGPPENAPRQRRSERGGANEPGAGTGSGEGKMFGEGRGRR